MIFSDIGGRVFQPVNTPPIRKRRQLSNTFYFLITCNGDSRNERKKKQKQVRCRGRTFIIVITKSIDTFIMYRRYRRRIKKKLMSRVI